MRHPVEMDQLEKIQSLRNKLTGALTTARRVEVVGGRFIQPPSWWVDDDEATAASLAAMAMMRRG